MEQTSLPPAFSVTAEDRSRECEPSRGLDPGRGFIVWLTGPSGAGKSTIAFALRDRLGQAWRSEILDGDEMRRHLCADLGFSKEARDTNVRRIAFVARMLARHGVAVIVAAISPYASIREEACLMAENENLTFLEMHVTAELSALIRRDPKGLYRRALAGALPNFTGISDPYEAPIAPDLRLQTDRESVAESVERIVALLVDEGLVTADGGPRTHPTPVSRAGEAVALPR
jgi:adenylyl-sulfate kinase